METKKLNFLLNKVVELNRPNEIYVKGFLYFDNYADSYYLKIVEVMLGSLIFNERYYLKKGDDKLLVKADKPKLMRVSMKSWHYRLIKYVLKSNTPTPQTMQNGCPYFWLLIFSALVVVFILLWKGFLWVINLFPRVFEALIIMMVDSWIGELEDIDAYDMYWSNKLPLTGRIRFNSSENSFFNHYMTEKYGITKGSEEFRQKKDEISKIWHKIFEKREAKRRIIEENFREKIKIRNAKRKEKEERWEKRMQPVNAALNSISDKFSEFGTWLKITFTVKRGGINAIVKNTKQVVGAVVTLSILVLTYFVVNIFALFLMLVIDFCIANWIVFVVIGMLAAGCGILYVLGVVIFSWIEKIINKYKGGKRIWYIEPFTWVYWLVKMVVLGIAFTVYYLFLIPIKFIFYDAFWKRILVPIGKFIGRFFVGLVKGLLSSTGIFGEYFGASYSDFCPGLEWVDIEEDE